MTFRINSAGSEVTEQLAAEMGTRLRGGEVLVLSSDLGGGKTTFVRGLARGMGSSDHVASPTFTLSREYQAGDLTLYHFDFYRLDEPGIVAAELQEFLDDPQAVVAVEWGGVVKDVLPGRRLDIQIERTGETTRIITIAGSAELLYLLQEIST